MIVLDMHGEKVLRTLVSDIRACQICAGELPHATTNEESTKAIVRLCMLREELSREGIGDNRFELSACVFGLGKRECVRQVGICAHLSHAAPHKVGDGASVPAIISA